MSAEEEQTFERQNAEIDRLDEVIKTGLRSIEREQEAAEARAQFESYEALLLNPPRKKFDLIVTSSKHS